MSGWLPRSLRRALTAVILAVAVLALAPSALASAHDEVVASTLSNGDRLSKPPAQVTLTYTESVNLIDGGIRLVDSLGDPVSTPAPSVDGPAARGRRPSGLPNCKSLVSCELASADGHPVQGAFSFGIGVDAQGVVGA